MSYRLTFTRLLVDAYRECFRFYRDVMELEPTFGDEESGYADFRTGDVTLALFDRKEMRQAILENEGGPRASDRVALIFGVEDVDESAAELEGRGARRVYGATDHPEWGIRTAHFRDPDGNLIEINTPLTT